MSERPLESPGESVNESELLERLADGDREAFATLFRRYQATIYRFAKQMTGSREDAEDVTQDVFIAFAAQSDRFDPARGSLGTYLYGIARNMVRRRRRLWKAGPDPAALEEAGSPAIAASVDLADSLAHAERVRALRGAILRLPMRYREILVLCALNGVAYEEAGRIVGCPVGTVRSRLHRARQMLIERCQRLADGPLHVRGPADRGTAGSRDVNERASWVSDNAPPVRGET